MSNKTCCVREKKKRLFDTNTTDSIIRKKFLLIKFILLLCLLVSPQFEWRCKKQEFVDYNIVLYFVSFWLKGTGSGSSISASVTLS